MNIYDYAERKNISTRQVLDFTTLANPIGPSTKAKNAMRKALKSIACQADPEARYLRRFIAKREHTEPENMLFGHGSTQLLDLLLAGMKPRRVLVPGPSPRVYEKLVRRHGAEMILLPSRPGEPFALDGEGLLRQIDRVDVVLLPNPHTLTGTVTPLSLLNEVVDTVEDSGKLLVLDEALIEFAGAASPVERAVTSKSTVILRSLSCFHSLGGLRLGYALGSRGLLDVITGVCDPAPVNTIATAGAVASLRDKGFYRRTQEFLKEEKSYLIAKLGRVGSISLIDTACNFLLVKLEGAVSDVEDLLRERRILIERFEDEGGASHVRLPMLSHRENAWFARNLAWIVARSDAPSGRDSGNGDAERF